MVGRLLRADKAAARFNLKNDRTFNNAFSTESTGHAVSSSRSAAVYDET